MGPGSVPVLRSWSRAPLCDSGSVALAARLTQDTVIDQDFGVWIGEFDNPSKRRRSRVGFLNNGSNKCIADQWALFWSQDRTFLGHSVETVLSPHVGGAIRIQAHPVARIVGWYGERAQIVRYRASNEGTNAATAKSNDLRSTILAEYVRAFVSIARPRGNRSRCEVAGEVSDGKSRCAAHVEQSRTLV